ncbi:ATP-binding cassette sub-family G member 1-like [Oppia nitens]|uniref:ATP-binding cassette sub-family G member 1-like n=1 Tax=Oppia nitens TaxID=1686743 RepID=UPI0023DA5F29|nr:ATP-binding cassette sub-family G member 1-like [Oppia nitens]
MLCSQSFGTIIATILGQNKRLSVMTSMTSFIALVFFCNYAIPIKEFIYPFQLFSEITFQKHLFNGLLIVTYGLGRCGSGQSRVFYDYKIDDNSSGGKSHRDFWFCLMSLLIIFLVLKIIEFVLLITSINVNFEETQNNDQLADENGLQFNRLLLIAWIELTLVRVQTNSKKTKKNIFNQLSGGFDLNTINAVMGPSGAGKTSLLKCLSGQNSQHLTDKSKIYLTSSMKIRTCFISQNIFDHLVTGLTVKQYLIYASKLKNSCFSGKSIDHKVITDKLMDEMLINDISDINVSHCSGGQLKRIVIASELTVYCKPNILFIDEPTSGVDSYSALKIISCLKMLCRRHNMSVITTIHQPNSDLLELFDKVYVLSRSGTNIFSGRPQDIHHFLNANDSSYQQNLHPIEHMLMLASVDHENSCLKKLSQTNNLSTKEGLISRCNVQTIESTKDMFFRSKRFYLSDLWHLTVRNMLCSYVYEWKSICFQIVLYLGLAIGLSTLYNRRMILADGCVDDNIFTYGMNCTETEESLNDESLLKRNLQYHMSFLMGSSFIQIILTTMTFSSKVNIFFNEHRNGWYSTGAYYISKSVIDFLPLLISMLMFSYIINYYDSKRMYFVYLYTLLFVVLCSQSFGHISGIIFSNNQSMMSFTTFFKC